MNNDERHTPDLDDSAAASASILIVGLGNPILGDDGAGWKVAEQIEAHLGGLRASVAIEYASLGGLSLMERLLGYRTVILIDAMQTGDAPIGTVRVFPLSSLPNPASTHSASAHDSTLITALEAAAAMAVDVPDNVYVVAIECAQTFEFSEKLSPEIQAVVPLATRKALELLRSLSPNSPPPND